MHWAVSTPSLMIWTVVVAGLLDVVTAGDLSCYYCNDCIKEGVRKVNCDDKYAIPNDDYRDRERVKLACFKRGNSKGCTLVSRTTDLRCYDSYEHHHTQSRENTRQVLDMRSPENWYEPLEDVYCVCDENKCNSGGRLQVNLAFFAVVTTNLVVHMWATA